MWPLLIDYCNQLIHLLNRFNISVNGINGVFINDCINKINLNFFILPSPKYKPHFQQTIMSRIAINELGQLPVNPTNLIYKNPLLLLIALFWFFPGN